MGISSEQWNLIFEREFGLTTKFTDHPLSILWIVTFLAENVWYNTLEVKDMCCSDYSKFDRDWYVKFEGRVFRPDSMYNGLKGNPEILKEYKANWDFTLNDIGEDWNPSCELMDCVWDDNMRPAFKKLIERLGEAMAVKANVELSPYGKDTAKRRGIVISELPSFKHITYEE